MFISHTESIKAFKSCVYSATAIGISWISSAGCIWSFRTRAPSGLRMKIYYWSQDRASLTRCAWQSQLLPNRDCDLIAIYHAALLKRALSFGTVSLVHFLLLHTHSQVDKTAVVGIGTDPHITAWEFGQNSILLTFLNNLNVRGSAMMP